MRKIEMAEAEKMGGSEEEIWTDYVVFDEKPYYDKAGHLERSMTHQPNHRRAAKRKELIAIENIC